LLLKFGIFTKLKAANFHLHKPLVLKIVTFKFSGHVCVVRINYFALNGQLTAMNIPSIIFNVVKLFKDKFDCGVSKLNGHLTCLNEFFPRA
jgi:hypothetical protein